MSTSVQRTAAGIPSAKAAAASSKSQPKEEVKCPKPGMILGQYQLQDLMASTDLSSVYQGIDLLNPDRKVVIKFVNPELTSEISEAVKKLLHNEIDVISSLKGPAFPQYYADGGDYLVMEYLKGRLLRDLIEKDEMPFYQRLEIAVSIANGLSESHKQGYIHRDLKPENLMIKDAQAKIFDFTLTCHPGYRNPYNDFAGTPAYGSPEQIFNLPLDHRVDIYAFGLIIHEMVSGYQAMMGETLQDVYENQQYKPLPKIERQTIAKRYSFDFCSGLIGKIRKVVAQWRVGRMHKLLVELTTKMTQKDRNARLGDMGEIIRQLEKAQRIANKLARNEVALAGKIN